MKKLKKTIKKITNSPHISLNSEDAIDIRLGGHPFNGQHSFAPLFIVIRPVYVPRHAEVRDLDHSTGTPRREEAVTSGYVSV